MNNDSKSIVKYLLVSAKKLGMSNKDVYNKLSNSMTELARHFETEEVNVEKYRIRFTAICVDFFRKRYESGVKTWNLGVKTSYLEAYILTTYVGKYTDGSFESVSAVSDALKHFMLHNMAINRKYNKDNGYNIKPSKRVLKYNDALLYSSGGKMKTHLVNDETWLGNSEAYNNLIKQLNHVNALACLS